MKDLYSFDIDDEGLDVSYQKMYYAYNQIFTRLGLKYRVVEADSGAIGGNESHEFMVLADSGEAEIVYCDNCDYAANVEKAVCIAEKAETEGNLLPLEKIHTPGQRTIQDLTDFLKIGKDEQIKTLMYDADGELIAAILRGDRELNEIKLKNALGCNELVMANEENVRRSSGAGFGSLGPVGMDVKIYADLEVAAMKNFACGANEDDYHFKNVNLGRDFVPEAILDIRNAVPGDPCPLCQGELKLLRGIEVGHIFKLGTKYSDVMGATFRDQNGQSLPFVMGCYGIGISRTMAAAVEQNSDENGIIWPIPIAPYQVIVVPVNSNKEEQLQAADSIYKILEQEGLEVILDDRDERAGVKFKDADLIGIPVRITIGPKALQENKVEVKKRWEKEVELVEIDEVREKVLKIIGE